MQLPVKRTMQTLTYETRINASATAVWKTLTDQKQYRQWVKAFSPDSYFDGEWTKGTYINFLDPNMGGTRAFIESLEPDNHILVRHASLISKEGEESTTGEMADKWIGTTEDYLLTEDQNTTLLKVTIVTHAEFVQMFDDCWPQALETIKELSEQAR